MLAWIQGPPLFSKSCVPGHTSPSRRGLIAFAGPQRGDRASEALASAGSPAAARVGLAAPVAFARFASGRGNSRDPRSGVNHEPPETGAFHFGRRKANTGRDLHNVPRARTWAPGPCFRLPQAARASSKGPSHVPGRARRPRSPRSATSEPLSRASRGLAGPRTALQGTCGSSLGLVRPCSLPWRVAGPQSLPLGEQPPLPHRRVGPSGPLHRLHMTLPGPVLSSRGASDLQPPQTAALNASGRGPPGHAPAQLGTAAPTA